ncbi:hypothetical protein ACHAWC_007099 [Mediolabrus comicus]
MSLGGEEEVSDLIRDLDDLIATSPAGVRGTNSDSTPSILFEEESTFEEVDSPASALFFGEDFDSTMVDTTANPLSQMFDQAMAIADVDLQKASVILPREQRGSEGSKERAKHRERATEALDPKFGIARHFVSSRHGEEDAGNHKYQHIQDLFVSNAAKLEKAVDRFIQYDMMSSVQIPTLKDVEAIHAKDRWNHEENSKRNLFEHFGAIPMDEVKLWQADILRFGSKYERENSEWILSFLKESCTIELNDRINSKFKELPLEHKGGVVYLKLMIDVIMFMSRDVVRALQKYISNFAVKGLTRIPGESVTIAEKELKVVCTHLHEVGQLPIESAEDVLTGLTKCSVEEFRSVFHSLLQWEKQTLIKSIGLSGGSTIDKIRETLNEAVDLYVSLCTSEKWHVSSKRTSACFNCGGDHKLPACPKPHNEEEIKKNRNKFKADKAENSSGSGNSHSGNNSQGGNQQGSGGGSKQYTRGKWGKPTDGRSVKRINGAWHTWCEKCGWTKTHSTKFHAQYESDPSNFTLPKTHPFTQAKTGNNSRNNNSQQQQQGSVATASGTNTAASGGAGATLTINSAQAKATLERFERESTDPNTAALMGMFKEAFGLN